MIRSLQLLIRRNKFCLPVTKVESRGVLIDGQQFRSTGHWTLVKNWTSF